MKMKQVQAMKLIPNENLMHRVTGELKEMTSTNFNCESAALEKQINK